MLSREIIGTTGKDDYETPQHLFDQLNARYHFTLDAAASADNAKCARYFDKARDALVQSWKGERVFLNPPYGKALPDFVKKAYQESLHGALVVMLIPARTDTSYWHDYIFAHANIRFLRGRLKFSGLKSCAPFPSAVVVFGLHPPAGSAAVGESCNADIYQLTETE